MIVPVIDLLDGVVVRARGGERRTYLPVESRLAGDARPSTVAQAFRNLGYQTVYVADLNAIAGQPLQTAAYRDLHRAGLQLWLDAGIADCSAARALQERASWAHLPRVIVGLESVHLPAELPALVQFLGPDRAMFSLDLRQQRPLVRANAWRELSPLAIAERACAAGMRQLLVLDLAQVGQSRGPGTVELCRQLRATFPACELAAGGGVRDADDVQRLYDAGCQAVLVASALHDGIDLEALRPPAGVMNPGR